MLAGDHVGLALERPFAVEAFEFVLHPQHVELLAEVLVHLAEHLGGDRSAFAHDDQLRFAILAADVRGILRDPEGRTAVDAAGIDETHAASWPQGA